MGTVTIAPTGQEHTFDRSELIVSKTDLKGHITYANDVFLRVSHYPLCDVLGQAHKLIRHPEMPRGVFRLLWNTISDGHELFAVINNLASDGGHYWVLAHVTPTFGPAGQITGYHSNRRLPDKALIDAVTPLYQRMCAAEAQQARAVDAAEAGSRVLDEHLADRGQTYDQYIWQLIHDSGSDL